MEWMLLPLKRYAQFTGRAQPREYWMYVLFLLICYMALGIIESALGLGATTRWMRGDGWNITAGARHNGGVLTALFWVATLVPSIAVSIRRLHDTDRSGWWLLLWLIPFFGWIVLFVFMVMGGTRGPNRFGPDPVETASEPPA